MTRTVLVTGASSGIGRAAAEAFAARGDNVVLNAQNESKLDAVVRAIGRPAQLRVVAGDIGLLATSEQMVAAAVKAFGGVDVLVNNAGIFAAKPLLDHAEVELDGLVHTNLKGSYFAAQCAVRQMRVQGRGGAIVNVTASIALHGLSAVPASAASSVKGSINALTTSLALELAPDNIRVNAVAPGMIKTPLHGRTEAQFEEMNGLQPIGRVGTTRDIVDAILYFADAQFTTGVIMPVDGGATTGKW